MNSFRHFRVVIALAIPLTSLACHATRGPLSTAPAVTAPAVAAPESHKAPCLLACRMANYGRYQEAAWSHLPSIGVKYVFMSVPKPEELEETQKRLADHGLTALVLRGDADFTKDSAPDDLAGQLAVCEKMGVHYMFLSVKGKWPDKEIVYARLRRAGDIAKQHNVTLSLETHPPLGTNADVQLETMKGVHHPNVRVNFDTGNITYYNHDRDAAAELKKIIDYVATVEIKDHSGEFETWNFPVLGKGAVKIPDIVQTLKAHGYAGPITIEIEGVKDVERDEVTINREIAESIAYLRSLLGC